MVIVAKSNRNADCQVEASESDEGWEVASGTASLAFDQGMDSPDTEKRTLATQL